MLPRARFLSPLVHATRQSVALSRCNGAAPIAARTLPPTGRVGSNFNSQAFQLGRIMSSSAPTGARPKSHSSLRRHPPLMLPLPMLPSPRRSADDQERPQEAGKARREARKAAAKDALKSEKAPRTPQAPAPKRRRRSPRRRSSRSPMGQQHRPREKKDLSQPMENGYNPLHVEQSWYQWWRRATTLSLQSHRLRPAQPEKTFIVPAPPPNVHRSLHIGHALTISIQDTLIRYRMNGYRTLFNPGYDHAGIATQASSKSASPRPKASRATTSGREKFLEKVFEWKDDYQSRISNQMRRLGASYDFSREAFTMDEPRSKAVTEPSASSTRTASSTAPTASSTGAASSTPPSPTSRSTRSSSTAAPYERPRLPRQRAHRVWCHRHFSYQIELRRKDRRRHTRPETISAIRRRRPPR